MRIRWERGKAVAVIIAAAGLLAATAGSAAGSPGGRPAPGEAGTAFVQPRSVTTALPKWATKQRSADVARRKQRRTTAPTALSATVARAVKSVGAVPGKANALRAASQPTTLVLYDTAGPYGFLGELYAMATANLAGHFGTVTTKPVSQYTSGQINQFTATIYIGSTYYGGDIPDAIPNAFYTDVATSTQPVIWMNDNIWNLAGKVGVPAFTARYGWDPTTSYFDVGGSVGQVTQVDYKTQPLGRNIPAGADSGILRPNVLTGPGYPAVTSLAEAVDTSTSPNTRFPWAVRSSNLTYIGEIPYTYFNESDRAIAFYDLLFDALEPTTPTRHRALLRLEDISPGSDPEQLMDIAEYLTEEGIPYGFQLIPVYTDPKGAYNDGVPETRTLQQAPAVMAAVRYMLAHGGTIIDHGYTHQYGNVDNPYNGVTGDDFEFFRAHVDSADNVIYDGPVAEDSAAWANSRIVSAKTAFLLNLLPTPKLWTTPHYAASATDYGVINQHFTARYERSLYYAGQLTPAPINPQVYMGQFFPYPVKDVYGSKVIPENLGNYEPDSYNNRPPRLPADMINSAKLNLAVRDGFASFFYHPYYPVAPLRETVQGIRALGYTFVSPTSVVLP
ncbi:DUF2334 domain-containing protein [Actinomadura sp. HBU206391]|uniref:DUF2334 domain-containing protein n=1 Tax=Actinomadura sp. HBU206391 TaxID=2731692 RepID=UPI00164FC529|nr:polysaccharide deacetylase family protein [Actinomadura sp. HBU206391]MBC6457229.1 DUF2334 domain-containing protein [Actinomadura sp. HBU206391]